MKKKIDQNMHKGHLLNITNIMRHITPGILHLWIEIFLLNQIIVVIVAIKH